MTNALLEYNHQTYSKEILRAWSDFITKGTLSNQNIRPEIIQSWERSKKYSVDPFQERVNEVLRYNHLKNVRDENDFLLSIAEPIMKTLSESLHHTETLVTLADKNGVILNTFGDSEILVKSEQIGLVPGSIWNENIAGTNAVGIVLDQKKPIQVLYNEHFSVGWHTWTSNAAPIFHPLTNELIGVFDIAGTFKNVSRQTLELAISTTKLISNQIIRNIYKHDVTQNPYINALFQTVNDPMLIIDSKKNIVKLNQAMESILKREERDQLFNIDEINELFDFVFRHKKQVERDVTLHNSNIRYLCKMYPIQMNMSVVGVIVSLKKLERKTAQSSHSPFKAKYQFNDIIGNSEKLKRQILLAKKAAKIDVPLFICGESGTGKEMFAQSIHNASERKNGPFVAVNCGAIPQNLIESELFGYEGGAFTGANAKGKKGKFELAQGGTIFLDEIGDMPLNVQVQLLRVLEEKEITRIGGQKTIPLNIRIIAATHKNLIEEVKSGRFREDLYYRINGIRLSLPSLHERGNDILLLARYFINKLSPMFNKKNVQLSDEASSLLLKYKWPGNLREMKNIIQQILFVLDGQIIMPHHLPEKLHENSIEEEIEKAKIIEAIKIEKGHMKEVAKRLGISRSTLYRKLNSYRISKESILHSGNDS